MNLGEITTDLSLPVGEPVDGVIQAAYTKITALNNGTLALAGVERIGPTLVLTSSVHVGNPPVIGDDGILYGNYESPDIVSAPITPAGGSVEWTTEVGVPEDVTGLIVLPSVESKQQRLFVNYASTFPAIRTVKEIMILRAQEARQNEKVPGRPVGGPRR